MHDRPSPGRLLALAITTACTLALQVVLTRFFAAVMAYHFGFLAISLALLGTSAGALAIYLIRDRFETLPTDRLLALLCGTFALLLIATPVALVRLDFTHDSIYSPSFFLNLSACCLLSALPCFASGMVVALAIDRYRRFIGAVYAYDLVGAALGALLVIPALSFLDAPALIVCLGVLAALATVLFAGSAPRVRWVGLGLMALGIGLVALSRVSAIVYLPNYYALPPDAVKVSERWTPLARVLGFRMGEKSRLALLYYDRVFAPVPVVQNDKIPDWKELATGAGSIGYELTGAGHTLIIGGGGGRDIYTALSAGQRQVDVIELMEAIRTVVDEDLGHLSGRPYSRRGVSTVIGDGRSVLAHRKTAYDQIYIGLTDTLSATAAHGFSLSENSLYTVEAFGEYLDHLRPYGVLNVTRPLKQVGDEALRIAVLTLKALELHGVREPFRHVVVVIGKDFMGQPVGAVLARLKPYTEQEVTKLSVLAKQRGIGLALAPGIPHQGAWAKLAQASSIESFCDSHRLNVCPPTDDKPFFFTMQRLSNIGQALIGYHYAIAPYTVLIVTLAILTVFSALALALPLFLVKTGQPPTLSSVSFFAAIGLGFMLLEIVLIQRLVLFLGFPTYALSVVLFSLLVFSGFGSVLSTRYKRERRTLTVGLALLFFFIAASAFAGQDILRRLMHLPFAGRALVSVALMAPFGITAGMAMPLGLKRLAALFPQSVAYAWGVNGVASVLASVLGVAVAINFGFTAVSLLSAACYCFALAHVVLGRWAQG